MRVIAWKVLREYIESGHADAAEPLREWFRIAEVVPIGRTKLADVRKVTSQQIWIGDRLVLMIMREYLSARLPGSHFGHPILYVRWIGTHTVERQGRRGEVMSLKVLVAPVRTEAEHEQALQRIDELFDAPEGTPEFDEFDILTILVHEYEQRRRAAEEPDPSAALRHYLDRMEMTAKDLEPYIGTKSMVSMVTETGDDH